MFIKRAVNSTDRWSGHVAFPGGRQEGNETSYETVVREVEEEVGINLMVEPWRLIGRLDDFSVPTYKNARCLTLSTFVFLCGTPHNPKHTQVRMDPTEVASVGWVPAAYFCGLSQGLKQHCVEGWGVLAAPILGTGMSLRYHSLTLPMKDLAFAQNPRRKRPEQGSREPNTPVSNGLIKEIKETHKLFQTEFVLWGLTLGRVAEFLHLVGFPDFKQRVDQDLGWEHRIARRLGYNTLLFLVGSYAKVARALCWVSPWQPRKPDHLGSKL